jgi:hypothetical protein
VGSTRRRCKGNEWHIILRRRSHVLNDWIFTDYLDENDQLLHALTNLTHPDAGANSDVKDDVQRGIIAAIARFFLSTVIVFLFALVQGFRHGFLQRDYTVLILGSVVSVIAAFAYGAVGVARTNGRRQHVWMVCAIFSGWLPYFFTLYLIGYRGLWRLFHVFRPFSLAPFLSSVMFIVIGLIAIRYLQLITDLTRTARRFQEL